MAGKISLVAVVRPPGCDETTMLWDSSILNYAFSTESANSLSDNSSSAAVVAVAGHSPSGVSLLLVEPVQSEKEQQLKGDDSFCVESTNSNAFAMSVSMSGENLEEDDLALQNESVFDKLPILTHFQPLADLDATIYSVDMRVDRYLSDIILVCGAAGGHLSVWRLNAQELEGAIKSIRSGFERSGDDFGLAFSCVSLLELAHDGDINDACFIGEFTNSLLTSSSDGTAKVWGVDLAERRSAGSGITDVGSSLKLLTTVAGTRTAWCCAVVPDPDQKEAEVFAFGTSGGRIRAHRIDDGSSVVSWKAVSGWLVRIAATERAIFCGNEAITGNAHDSIRVYANTLYTSNLPPDLLVIVPHCQGPSWGIGLLHDFMVCSIGARGTCPSVNLMTYDYQLVSHFTGVHDAKIRSVAVDAATNFVSSCGVDGRLAVYHVCASPLIKAARKR